MASTGRRTRANLRRAAAQTSHRRHQAVLADENKGGVDRAVLLLGPARYDREVPGLTSASAAGATRRKLVAPRRTAFRQHGDAKLTDLLQTLANCLKARALSLSTTDARPATASVHEIAARRPVSVEKN